MARLQAKSFDDPDERRAVARASLRLVHLDEVAVGHGVWEPGWRWSVDLKPVAGTASCQNHHLGYALSGVLEVLTDAGEGLVIPAGSVYEIPPGHDAWVVGDEPFVTVEWTSSRLVGVAPEGPDERVLATVLFTDIVDSTATLERLGDRAWRELLLAHNHRMREVLAAFRGREVATTGDGFLVVFDGATNAVRCGAAMVKAAQDLGVQIRVGIHTGEVELIGDDVGGMAVNIGARIGALADAGELLVSSTVRELVVGSGLEFDDRGPHTLKGAPGEWRLFAVA